MMFMIHNTQYIDISITISTIQLYTGSLSGHTVHHLAGVQYTTIILWQGVVSGGLLQYRRLQEIQIRCKGQTITHIRRYKKVRILSGVVHPMVLVDGSKVYRYPQI